MTNPNPTREQNEWLADFADRILEGRPADPSATGSDPEMQALAHVLLRLNHALSPKDPEAAVARRMHGEILRRWRKEEQSRPKSWIEMLRLNWLAPSRRSQLGWALAVIAVAGALVFSFQAIAPGAGSMTATAGLDLPGIFLWFIPLLAVTGMIWLLRRKP